MSEKSRVIVRNNSLSLNSVDQGGPVNVTLINSRGVLVVTDGKDRGVEIARIPLSVGAIASKFTINLPKKSVNYSWEG